MVLILRWPENYGKTSDGVLNSVSSSLSTATKAVKSDRRVALLAAVSALFEGATKLSVPATYDAAAGTGAARGLPPAPTEPS